MRQLDELELRPTDSLAFTEQLHAHGINVRHIGRIAERTRLPHVRELVVVEMVARIAKRALRDELQRIMRVAKRKVDRIAAERADASFSPAGATDADGNPAEPMLSSEPHMPS